MSTALALRTAAPIDDVRQRRLADLSREHHRFLLGLARRLCRSGHDPEDLVQDVLERTVKHVDHLPDTMSLRPWLARVLRNLFIDRVRRAAVAPRLGPIDDLPLASPEPEPSPWWQSLETAQVRARVTELPEELRTAFELFAFEGCSYQEICARLGIPRATVGTRILRARRRLKQLLELEGPIEAMACG